MKLAKLAAICAAAVSVSAIADDASTVLTILPVSRSLTFMPLTVNYTDAAGNLLTAEKVVKTANLPDNSKLYVYTGNQVYIKYTLKSDKSGWDLVQDKTYTVGSNGQLSEGTGVTSDNQPVARGAAVFLETPSATAFYLAGTMPETNTVTQITEGANLVGVPKAAEFNLNGPGVTFSNIASSTVVSGRISVAGDIIEVPTSDNGASTRYYYNGTAWGKIVTSGSGFTMTSSFDAEHSTIPAGQGFWYVRKAGAGATTITW